MLQARFFFFFFEALLIPVSPEAEITEEKTKMRTPNSLEEYMKKKYATRTMSEKRSLDIDQHETDDPNSKKKRLNQENKSSASRKIQSGETEVLDANDTTIQENTVARKPIGGLRSHEELVKEQELKEKKTKDELDLLKRQEVQRQAIERDPKSHKLTEYEIKDLDKAKQKKLIEDEIKHRNRNEAGILEERKLQEKINEMKSVGLNNYEDDEKLLSKQKEDIKSEDPALLFNKNVIQKHKKKLESKYVSISGRKLYKDESRYPPNRFNIKPGWRWDGIIRGNGFEQKWFDRHTTK